MNMKSVGTIRMSKSCHNIAEEDIYVEPDHSNHHPSTVALPTVTAHTLPSRGRMNLQTAVAGTTIEAEVSQISIKKYMYLTQIAYLHTVWCAIESL